MRLQVIFQNEAPSKANSKYYLVLDRVTPDARCFGLLPGAVVLSGLFLRCRGLTRRVQHIFGVAEGEIVFSPCLGRVQGADRLDFL